MRIRAIEPRDREEIHEIQRRYPEMWDAPDANPEQFLSDFDSPDNILMLVAEDDNGQFLAVVGAMMRYEIWMTMDRRMMRPEESVRVLQRLFARLVVEMFRRGFKAGFAKIPEKLRSWSNMLTKRFGFERLTGHDIFWFNAERELGRVKDEGAA